MSASKEVLAQQAAARLVAAACGEERDTWNRQEQLHDAATTQAAALAAATPLLQICASCRIVADCRQWAIVDEYTGIAAGTAWTNGVEKSAHWVPRRPPRRLAG
ncbi:hypothetical protein [Actinopolymorpha pittospori]|uniref:4Fe-4S Wbl-type domain-containing protein n=1 Tax=Actinopolymorpha pittospori TaxID=648752 RepID=A0A927RM77_9ACTN|nr:hypothetical protein [Actinopolymorpha pittospori]MBE1609916.1 hypothetical protein [Actinopolymorpha pittospori]